MGKDFCDMSDAWLKKELQRLAENIKTVPNRHPDLSDIRELQIEGIKYELRKRGIFV